MCSLPDTGETRDTMDSRKYSLTADQIISEGLLTPANGKVVSSDTDFAGSTFVYIEFATLFDAAAYVRVTDTEPFVMIVDNALRFGDSSTIRFASTAYQNHADSVNGYDAKSIATRSDQYLMASMKRIMKNWK